MNFFRHSRFFFLSLLFLVSLHNLSGQITLSTGTLNFSTVFTNAPESLSVTLNNIGSQAFEVTDINLFHDDVFFVDDTAFTISAGGNHQVWITCAPKHNLTYSDFLFIENNSQPKAEEVFLFAFCKYPDTYYDPTQNKSHEQLKSALTTLISTGTTDLGYNVARDKMYMEIDNKRVNGQGAAQNTLECCYTGDLAVGYTSRSDCQTNDAFNTEHTFPQSMFGSVSPMLSDLHHLFPTKDYANTERANNPFGIVSSPTWSFGGSKSNGNTFEPRDIHKARAARALFYMVIRYQDYTGFVAPQEPILRQWCTNFPPSAIDSTRNAAIFGWQHNRNPFIDHNEFLERIASICSVDSGPMEPVIHFSQDTLYFQSATAGIPVNGALQISNQGIQDLRLTHFVFSNVAFNFSSPPDSVIILDSLSSLPIQFDPISSNTDYTSTLTVQTNDPAHPSLTIVFKADTYPVSRTDFIEISGLKIFPNPASEHLQIELPVGVEIRDLEISDLAGQILKCDFISDQKNKAQIDVSELSPGSYFLRVQSPTESETRLIIIQ